MSFNQIQPENETAPFPPQDEFQRTLAREEALASYSAMNKIREGILLAMGRDVQKGGDGSRFVKALAEARAEMTAAQEAMVKLFT